MLCFTLMVLFWTGTMFHDSNSYVYTSSQKIEAMVLEEEQILNNLHAAVRELGDDSVLSLFSKFYHERVPKVKERRNDQHALAYLRHPNGIYNSIKEFAADYETIRSILQSIQSPNFSKHLSSIADKEDITGARLSVLRLQDIYRLNTSEMVRGNYLGFKGPELSQTEVAEIGETAFNDRQWDYAISWLQEALRLWRKSDPTVGLFDDSTATSYGRILALLGRTYIRIAFNIWISSQTCELKQGKKQEAAEMYRKARSATFEADEHITALESELETQPATQQSDATDENLRRLCYQQNQLTQKQFDPRLTCSYKEGLLPYYRFKQELVSVSPYVALFYEVITDQEIDGILSYTPQKLYRAGVLVNGSAILDEYRISDISFTDDWELPVLAGLSKRVAAITDLNTRPGQLGNDLGAEPFQVVNYGMGGHYKLHIDFFNDGLQESPEKEQPAHNYMDDRLATFLIYLTDVERGGSTIFSNVDLAVSPVKNMALFWYNYKPSGEPDFNTRHAGCPVVVGHKWVSNKWIWLYGNTFTRRCGLTPEATQLDIEQYMRKGWI